MKKLYTIGLGLSFALMASQGFSQVNRAQLKDPVLKKTMSTENVTPKKFKMTQSKDFQVFWTEDFSNGFEGQGTNGTWTTAMDQGDLWFQTFPVGAANGYDPQAPLTGIPAYGNHLPNFFGSNSLLNSETADNGMMMLDVDRYNSTTEPGSPGTYTDNPVLAALVSPSIDMSGYGTTAIAIKFFEKLRMCCSGYSASMELSTDGGTTWSPYDVFSPYGGGNDIIEELVYIDISGALSSAADLSDVRIRFVWSGGATAYYWMVDDISIESLAENNLSLTKTYLSDYERVLVDPVATYADLYDHLEYNQQPNYYVHPFIFGGVVTNLGLNEQTGVQIHVNANLPDGSVIEDFAVSDPINLVPGATDTIYTSPVTPDLGTLGDAGIGEWTFDFVVLQNEEDQVPFYNNGPSRVATINSESMTTAGVPDGYALMANDANMTSGSSVAEDEGDDQIWGVAYKFPESTAENPKYITHIQTVLLNNGGWRETLPGNQIFFNVRKGAAYAEDPQDPSTMTSVVFDENDPYEYDDPSLRKIISDNDIWYSDTWQSGTPVPRITFELPSPVMIDPNEIYQAELRVPNNAGQPIVYVAVCKNQESSSAPMYDVAGGSWHGYTDLTYSIRFLTASLTDVKNVTAENGMELVQNYPNPFTTTTKIQYRLNESSNVSFEVRDISGKVVFKKDMGMASAGIPVTYDFNGSDLAPGVYTYSIITAKNVVTRKMTIQ